MPRAYSASAPAANSRGAETCTGFPESCTVSSLQKALSALIKMRNPHKAWVFVSDLFGLKERAAKHRLANARSYTVEELQLLLHSTDGREVLDLLMETASPIPEWWTEWRKTWELTAIRREQALLQQRALALDNTPMDRPARRKLKRFVDADRHLSATRAEKETAVGLLAANAGRGRAGAMDAAAAKIQAAGARR